MFKERTLIALVLLIIALVAVSYLMGEVASKPIVGIEKRVTL